MNMYYFFFFLTCMLVWCITAFYKRNKLLYNCSWLFLVTTMALFAAVRAPGVDRDYDNYISWFELIRSNFDIALSQYKDLGFVYTYKIFSLISSETWGFFLIISFLSLVWKKKFCETIFKGKYVGLLFILIVSRFYLLHEFTQIRAGLAIALSSYGVILYTNGRIKNAYFCFIASSTIHLSVITIPLLLMLFYLFKLLRERVFLLLLPVVGLLAGNISTFLLAHLDLQRILVYTDSNQVEKISLLSFYYLSRITVFYFIVFRLYPYLNKRNICIVFFAALSLFSNAFFSWNSVISLRIIEVLGMFDLAMFVIPLLYIKSNGAWIYKVSLFTYSLVLFLSTMKIINPYQTI
ncbi:TPA: EpsG family protein [Escherichia coli]